MWVSSSSWVCAQKNGVGRWDVGRTHRESIICPISVLRATREHSTTTAMATAEKLSPLSSPLPVELYPAVATLLLLGGVVFMCAFFLYETARTKHSRSLSLELVLAAIASGLLGCGTLFLLLWTGVFV